VLKLRAAGVEVDTTAAPGVQPRVRATDPAFAALVAAVELGRVVTFHHRRSPAAEPTSRTVQPWGVVSYRGRWYLVGYDEQRCAVRCFRVSRISAAKATGAAGAVTVPESTDVLALVAASAGPTTPSVDATILLAPRRALGLRRGAQLLHQGPDGDLVQVRLPPMDVAARWVAGYGADAVVIDPPELRERVLDTFSGALA